MERVGCVFKSGVTRKSGITIQMRGWKFTHRFPLVPLIAALGNNKVCNFWMNILNHAVLMMYPPLEILPSKPYHVNHGYP